MSSRHLGQDQYIHLGHRSSRHLQDVFKTSSARLAKPSSRHLQDVLPRYLQDSFKTSSRRLAKTSSRHLQDVLKRYLQVVFKTYHQVKLFLLTRLRKVFNMFLRRSFPKTVIYRGICQVTPLLRNLWSVYKIFKRDQNFSSFTFSLYYTFSGCLHKSI